jgi:hypothetical protein
MLKLVTLEELAAWADKGKTNNTKAKIILANIGRYFIIFA